MLEKVACKCTYVCMYICMYVHQRGTTKAVRAKESLLGVDTVLHYMQSQQDNKPVRNSCNKSVNQVLSGTS